MCGNEDDLPFFYQKPDDRILIDAGIFRLIDENRRCSREKGDISDHQRPGLAAAQGSDHILRVKRLTGQGVGAGEDFFHEFFRTGNPPASGMLKNKIPAGKFHDKVHTLGKTGTKTVFQFQP